MALDGEWVYTYDADGQLIHAVFTPNNSDPDGLTAQDIQYLYDPAGNRISETVNGVVTTYAVNNVNEYTSSTTNGITTSYQYDAAGNLTQEASAQGTTSYNYDEENRLTGVAGAEGLWNYQYDALGNRNATTHDGQTTDYLVDPAGLGSVVGEYDLGGLIAHYTYGLGLVSRTDATGSAAYYDFDALGSTIGLTSPEGRYVNTYNYLPFGEQLNVSESIANPFGYLGQWGVIDDRNGLLYMRARYALPQLGRFGVEDPLGLQSGSLNSYSYSFGDPINYVDPSGLQSQGDSLTSFNKTDARDIRNNVIAGIILIAVTKNPEFTGAVGIGSWIVYETVGKHLVTPTRDWLRAPMDRLSSRTSHGRRGPLCYHQSIRQLRSVF